MQKGNNPPDEVMQLPCGELERRGGTNRIVYANGKTETWTLPDTEWGIEQARANFADMAERWAE